ncbi:unnamed protein product, partial [Didymodactylos carnosus]
SFKLSLSTIYFQRCTSKYFPGTLRWNTTGITVAGQADGTSGNGSNQLLYPNSVFLDSNEDMYIADRNNYRIQKWLKGAVSGTTVAGNSADPNVDNQLKYPEDVYVTQQQMIYISDSYNYRIQGFTNGNLSSGRVIAGITQTPGNATNQLNDNELFSFDSTNTYLYVADSNNHRIIRFLANSTGGDNGTVVAGGNGQGNNINQLNGPNCIYLDSISNTMYIANKGTSLDVFVSQ